MTQQAGLARVTEQVKEIGEELGQYEQLLAKAEDIEKRHAEWVALREKVGALSQQAEDHHKLVLERSEVNAAIDAEKARLDQELKHLDQAEGGQ